MVFLSAREDNIILKDESFVDLKDSENHRPSLTQYLMLSQYLVLIQNFQIRSHPAGKNAPTIVMCEHISFFLVESEIN